MSAKTALHKYLEKQLKKDGKVPRKNQKPEKDVEAEVMTWLSANQFDCHVVESKAVYSYSAGRYLHGQTNPGFSDIVGNDANGMAVFIELKAKGRRSTLRQKQKAFLKKKIASNCFAVVVDSAELLATTYKEWSKLRADSPKTSQFYLFDQLPKKREKQEDDETTPSEDLDRFLK